jgi:hypothetical protein
MTFSESYMFVLGISLALCIPLGLAVRTLLATKHHVIRPILRMRITKSEEGDTSSSLQARRTSWSQSIN